MKINKVKIGMSIGVLLFITGCTAGVSTEPASGMQENLQAEAGSEIEADAQSEREGQQEKESPEPVLKEENDTAVVSDIEDDDFYVQGIQNLHQGRYISLVCREL